MVVSVGGRPDDPQYRHFYDGSGRSRSEWYYDKSQPPTVFLHTNGHGYESFGLAPDGRTIWQDHGPEDYFGVSDFGLSRKCIGGWEHRGFDLVAGRPAHHLVCDRAEYWVDREWLLAVRSQVKSDPLAYDTNVDELVSLQFTQPPAELFELPKDACVGTGRPVGCTGASGDPQPSPSAGS
jgi:hypothetical protein